MRGWLRRLGSPLCGRSGLASRILGLERSPWRGFSGAGSDEPESDWRRRRRRPLSPLERLSRLLPEELLSPEVQALRGDEPEPEVIPKAPSKDIPFQLGELVLAEVRRRRNGEFKRLWRLASAEGALNSTWGAVPHREILGRLPGQVLRTSAGHSLLVRRPTLEEFVLLMKRGPTIAYPKDISTMLLLMDISQGDKVLEAGSGSGGMSLFLSRAVGPQGHIISYEIRKDHHKLAKKNYQTWCDAWRIGHTVEWPDNVDFINADILTAAEDLKTITFDAIALDMLLPQNALPTVIPNLKQGGVCTVYLANITQVVDLLEAIRTRKLNLFCERIVEVTHRDWLVLPNTWRNSSIFQSRETKPDFDDELDGRDENNDPSAEEREHDEAFVSNGTKPPYIARPYPWQTGHTAVRGGVTGRPEFSPPYWYFAFFSDGFKIFKGEEKNFYKTVFQT
uniref:tRNA (adenine(58)-N(1))-methyltransferase n=1 Tax=Anolis carolinensis TaxID=28377 RepID=A0A803TQ81_ANOCA